MAEATGVIVQQFPGMRVCVMEREIERTQIGDFLGEAFAAVGAAMAEAGWHPSGPPVARYDMADGRFIVQAGFPIDDPGAQPSVGRAQPSVGRAQGIRVDEFPAGPAATLAFQGPYEQMPSAYQEVSRWMGEHGYRPDGRPWEQYLDGPEVAQPRTVIQWPCAPAHPGA